MSFGKKPQSTKCKLDEKGKVGAARLRGGTGFRKTGHTHLKKGGERPNNVEKKTFTGMA